MAFGARETSYSGTDGDFVPTQNASTMPAQAITGVHQDFQKPAGRTAMAGSSARIACWIRLLKKSG